MKTIILHILMFGACLGNVTAQNQNDTLKTSQSTETKAKITYPVRPEVVFEVPDESILGQSMRRGRLIYLNQCLRCHGDRGQGIEGLFPPLAKSDFLLADAARSIKVTLFGSEGNLKVNGKMYSQKMDGHSYLNDAEVADLHNFILNSWGNRAKMIGVNQVKQIRAEPRIVKEKQQLTKNK